MAAPHIKEKLAIDGGRPLRTRPFGPQWLFGEGDKRQLVEVIENAQAHGWRNRIKVEAFEKAFAQKHGVKHAKAVNTGTSACHTAIAAIDPEPGDEVITTPVTAIGTVSGVVLQNAIPVFADMDPDTFNIDPEDIERKITARTRAIMIVHLFGNPCDMDAILAIGRSHGIPVIEDCSQAHLARYQGRLVGTMGDIGVFSLGGKTLTTDQGGMVITDNDDLFERARDFASGGGGSLGDAHRFTNLEAAVGLAQLEGWDEATRVRLRTAAVLDEVMEGLPGFTPQKVRPGDVNSYYVYGYKIEEAEAGVPPAQFSEAVRAEGIPDCYPPYAGGVPMYKTGMFVNEHTYGRSRYPFVDEQGRRRVDYTKVRLPNIESELPKTGFILFRNSYTEDDARDIAAAMKKVSDYYAPRRTSP